MHGLNTALIASSTSPLDTNPLLCLPASARPRRSSLIGIGGYDKPLYGETMSDHFRFLEFPLEIRELIYRELLCTFQMKHKRERAYLHTRYDNPSAILRTSKQVYNEAFDYLVRRNQFIRLNCDGISIRFHPLGRQILPVTEDAKKISSFPGYVAQIDWSADTGQGPDASRKQYMVLGSQFSDILKCTDYSGITGFPTISMSISMNPITTQWQTSPGQTDRHLRGFQTNLLRTIPVLLHAFPRLRIYGSVDKVLVDRITHETALPRWTDPKVAITDLLWFKHNNEKLGEDAYYLSTNTVIESALQTIDYMRKSTSWAALKHMGGTEFTNAVSEIAFEFLVSRAQRALDAMERSMCRRSLVEKFGAYAEADLRECLTEPVSFERNDGATWLPSEQQMAVVMCMMSRRHRLLMDPINRDIAVRNVQNALATFPESEMIRKECWAVMAWSELVSKYLDEAAGVGNVLPMDQWYAQEEKHCDC